MYLSIPLELANDMNVQPDHTITEVTRMRNGNFCSTTYRKKLNAGENLIPSLVQPGVLSLGFLAGLARLA